MISDGVYYKRDDTSEWKGPGTVLGRDDSVVFIRHRSCCIKTPICQVQPVTVNCSNNIIEPEVTAPLAQLIKWEVKANEKPTINNENESDDDNYSKGNHNILKDTETKDNLDRKTADSADLPKLKRNNEIKFDSQYLKLAKENRSWNNSFQWLDMLSDYARIYVGHVSFKSVNNFFV